MNFTLTSSPNALHDADSTCDICDASAPFFFDPTDDEYCASLCAAHALLAISHAILDIDLST